MMDDPSSSSSDSVWRMSNSFLSLPRELIFIIGKELGLNDLKHMRLTCKALSNDMASLVLSHIFISAKEATTIEELVSDIQFLTKPESAAVNCSRELTFSAISSVFKYVDVALDLDERIREEFFIALTSFKTVQTVNWYPAGNDPLWLQENIWKAIRLFPNLRHLKIHSLSLKQSIVNFESLNALESISIFGSPSQHNGALFLSLSKLYASTSNLNSITMNNPNNFCDASSCYTLQQFFSSSPRGNHAHFLRRLTLSNIFIRLDDVTLSHLTHLTSFNLSSLPYTSSAGPGLSPNDIWVAFEQSKIRLQELVIGSNAMADSLNDYLSSFSGLKKLRLTIPSFLSRASAEASADRFWSKSFPNHVDTLEEFSLCAQYEGHWCFGRHNRSIFAKCTKLRYLTVSLLPEDIPRKESDFNGINTLIDSVVTHLPLITQLQIVMPSREIYRNDRCGTSQFCDRQRMIEWIPKHKPLASCQSLPRLTVSGGGSVKVFVGVKNGRRSRLRYCLSKEQ